ncbi:MAG: ATP-binding protein [Anaerolineales bacterium]
MRLRLLLAFILVILVSLLGVAFFMHQETAQEVYTFIYRGGIYEAEDLVTELEDHYQASGSWENVASLFPPPGKSNGQVEGKGKGRGLGPGSRSSSEAGGDLFLYDAGGNLVFDPHNLGAEGSLEDEEFLSAIPLVVDGETVGYLLPPGGHVFGQNVEAELLGQLNQALLSAALIAGGLALILALLLAFYLLRPVRELTRAATRMSEGDLTQRVRVGGKDELATLGKAFNHMAASLDEGEQRRQSMTADIAHELRTPLAVQRANLEAMLDGVYPLTAKNLGPVLEQNQLLTRLVADLRTIALADAGELTLNILPTDLNRIVSSVVERFRPQANRQQISLGIELDADCPVLEADRDRIEQILINLLNNALHYTPEGGEIRISTSCNTQTTGQLAGQIARQFALVEIRDSGSGIPPDALPHIFERFYRVDRSRSREEGGTGLGLAIARKLAEAHGGTLIAANNPEGGALFRLSLPIRRSSKS